MRKTILIDIVFFVLGLTYMYFDSQEYYTKKLDQQKNFYTHTIATYQDSLEVSRAMVGNSYEAFYTVSMCSTKAGCDFLDTALKLHDLNKERERLKEEAEKLRKSDLNKRLALINKRSILEKRLLEEDLGMDRGTYKRLHDELQADINNIDSDLSKLEGERKFDFDLLEEVLALTRNIPKTYQEAPSFLKKSYLNFFFEKIMIDNKKVVDAAYSPLVQELINQQSVILRKNWLLD